MNDFAQSTLRRYEFKFKSTQPRDKKGRWTSGGASGKGSEGIEFDEVMSEHYSGWAGRLSKDEAYSLKRYQGAGYGKINRDLRNETYRDDERVKKDVENIDNAINKSPGVPENVVVYRGISAEDDPGFEVGSTFVDRGYTSTSFDDGVASEFGDVVIRVMVPAGAPAIYMDAFNDSDEFELLLPRNTEFTVRGITTGSQGTTYHVQMTNVYDDSAFD